MKIDDYIKLTRRTISFDEGEHDIEFIKSRLDAAFYQDQDNCRDMDCRIISSNRILPESVLHDNHTTIIWDEMFWKYFNAFLVRCEYFSITEDPLIHQKIRNQHFSDCLSILSLSNEDFPSLSFASAIMSYSKFEDLNHLDSQIDKKKIGFISHIAKIYVLEHEIYHNIVKNGKNIFSRQRKFIQSAAKQQLDEIQKSGFDFEHNPDNPRLLGLKEIIESPDSEYFDEILCDHNAYYFAYRSLEFFGTPKPSLSYLKLFIEAIDKLDFFLLGLQGLIVSWRTLNSVPIRERKISDETYAQFDKELLNYSSRIQVAHDISIGIFCFSLKISASEFNFRVDTYDSLRRLYSPVYEELFHSAGFLDAFIHLIISVDYLGFCKAGWLRKKDNILNSRYGNITELFDYIGDLEQFISKNNINGTFRVQMKKNITY